MLAGIRVRPVDLARLLGVSKQAVSSWIAAGRITLGSDGRVDPRTAINRLLQTGDPSRLRAKFLAPVVAEVRAAEARNAELVQQLAQEREASEFHEGAATELLALIEALQFHLHLAWPRLRTADPANALAAVDCWIETVMQQGGGEGLALSDLIDPVQPATEPTKDNE